MKINRQKVIKWAKIFLLVYAATGIVLYYLQDYFLFHPQKIDANYKYNFTQKFEEINIPINETDTINLIKFLPEDSLPQGVVIYFHGNKNNVAHYAAYTTVFTKKGYEVWIADYPGFGKSTGTITEDKLYYQAMQIKKLADAKYSNNQIILYGKSLGTGIAAYVASQTKAKMLILETPYYSIPSLFSYYAPMYPIQAMANYKIPIYQYLENVAYPIIIFHGTADGVIPYSNAKKLKPFLKPADIFYTIQNGTHHNINSSQLYFTVLDSLL